MASSLRLAYHIPILCGRLLVADRRCLVLFKTHFWDDVVQRQFELLCALTNSGAEDSVVTEVILFVDETNGEVAIPPDISVPIIRSSCQKAADYGMADGTPPTRSFFSYGNDIPAVISALIYPGYDYYLMLEYDVVIQRPISSIVSWMKDNSVDFLAHPIDTPVEAWPWTYTCDGYYRKENIVKFLNCFAAFSRDALFHIIRRRLYFSNLIRQGIIRYFPHTEAFVATELTLSGYKISALREFGPVPHYSWGTAYMEEDLLLFRDDAFVHPVSDKYKYIRSCLVEDPFSYFQEEQTLKKRALRFPDETLPEIYNKLRGYASEEQLASLREDMRIYMTPEAKQKYGLDRSSIGRNCKAWQSSISQWSHSENEASDVLNHIPNGNYSFHTKSEENPWWIVDLGSPKVVDYVRIYNRDLAPWRANGLQILGCDDKENWTLYDSHRSDQPFEGLNGEPLILRVGARLRYLKLLLPGHECLHLDHIDIFEMQNVDLGDKCRTGMR